jgi:Tol biopolymer transport system component
VNPGTRLGPYEITAKLGEGGMGEVYRATDSKLKREVAIKVLPAAFTADPERLARFEREAQLLAQLQHPNIAAIFGLEESGGVRALVMELVDGEDLSTRIRRGALPLDEALPIARQIAEALEAAHEQGIVHRDLKPQNVMLRADGAVKVLDFGLAKALDPRSGAPLASPALMNSPTLTAAATGIGVILGTAAYMSPEQAKGRAVDRRADIWAFGVLLWECLTGKSLFAGETVAETIGYVVTREPDLSALPASTPPALVQLVARCLVRDPRQRLQSIGDARVVLEELIAHPEGARSAITAAPRGVRLPWLPWAVALGAGAALLWVLVARRPAGPASAPMPRRAEIVGISVVPSSGVAISPDGGEVIAYDMTPSRPRLLRRSLGSFEIQDIPGSESAFNPFYSPDGQTIGMFSDQQLCLLPVAGGTRRCIAPAEGFASGAWASDGTIVFSSSSRNDPARSGIYAVPSAGGEPRRLTHLDTAAGEREHLHPQVLPDGRTVVFSDYGQSQVSVAAVPLAGGAPHTLVAGGGRPRYLASGHLMYVDSVRATLHAVRFDLSRLQIVGTPLDLGIAAANTSDLAPFYDISRTGTLVYSDNSQLNDAYSVVRVDDSGRTTSLLEEPASWAQPRLSPDGKTLLLRRSAQPDCSLWLFDLARHSLSRLEIDGDTHSPMWEADGRHILTSIQRLTVQSREIFEHDLDGGGQPRLIAAADFPAVGESVSRDGRYVALVRDGRRDRNDIFVYDRANASLAPFATTDFDEDLPAFSPDGKWLAYASTETGRSEVLVRPFPGPGQKYAVSTQGGSGPTWARDGSSLFYAQGQQLMRAAIATRPQFSAGAPEPVFAGAEYVWERPRNYDVFPDGHSFAVVRRLHGAQATPSLRVVFDWASELARLAPGNP